MSFNCPKCGSENTQKISALNAVDRLNPNTDKLFALKGVGALFFWGLGSIPVGIVLGWLTGSFAMFFLVFLGGIAFGIAKLVQRMKSVVRSADKYADLPGGMKQNGFICRRCEHMFVPTA